VTSSSIEATTTSAVGGASSSSSAPGGPAGGELPFTGSGTPALLAVGLALVGLGGATLFARGRRGGAY
jgi:LPXTG-motif cell wall-anchored protein